MAIREPARDVYIKHHRDLVPGELLIVIGKKPAKRGLPNYQVLSVKPISLWDAVWRTLTFRR